MIEILEGKFGYCRCSDQCTGWMHTDEFGDVIFIIEQFYAQMLGWA